MIIALFDGSILTTIHPLLALQMPTYIRFSVVVPLLSQQFMLFFCAEADHISNAHSILIKEWHLGWIFDA